MAIKEEPDLLEDLFAEAAQDGPSPQITARVLADAAAEQAAMEAVGGLQTGSGGAVAVAPVASGGWIGGLINSVGGWPGISGVTLAGIGGLALGFYAPDLIDTWSGGQIWTLSGGAAVTPDLSSLWAGGSDV